MAEGNDSHAKMTVRIYGYLKEHERHRWEQCKDERYWKNSSLGERMKENMKCQCTYLLTLGSVNVWQETIY